MTYFDNLINRSSKILKYVAAAPFDSYKYTKSIRKIPLELS